MLNTVLRPSRALLCVLAISAPACGTDPGATSDASEGSTGVQTTATTDEPTTGTSTAAETIADPTTDDASTTGTTTVDTSTTADATTTDATTGDTTTDATTTDATTGDATTGDTTGETTGGLDTDALVLQLEQAVDGVLFLSESDYPWTVVAFEGGAPVTEANVKALIAAVYVPHDGQATLEERTIEVRTPSQLFDPLTVPQDWWTDFEVMQAEQYTVIRDLLEGNLTNLQVFRFGELSGNDLVGAIDVYVLGETADGDVVGMWTVSVET